MKVKAKDRVFKKPLMALASTSPLAGHMTEITRSKCFSLKVNWYSSLAAKSSLAYLLQ